jgi:aryl-alcohol dehydrogenase-like predicted oxidoreductase
VIAGGRKPEQIRELAKAVEVDLDPQVIQKLNTITEQVKQRLGPNPDMWMSESRFR